MEKVVEIFYYSYLFEHRQALDDSRLLEYEQKVGLDIDRFKKEM